MLFPERVTEVCANPCESLLQVPYYPMRDYSIFFIARRDVTMTTRDVTMTTRDATSTHQGLLFHLLHCWLFRGALFLLFLFLPDLQSLGSVE